MRSEKTKELSQEVVVNLVTVLISVNNWALDKTYAIHPGLSSAGLFDLNRLRALQDDEVAQLLFVAGYSKSQFVRGLIAKRLKSLAATLEEPKLEQLCDVVKKNDSVTIRSILRPIHGIGPVVIERFLALQGIAS